MATPTAKGSANSKASGTTLTISDVSVPQGHSLVVGVACENGSLAPDTVMHSGRTLKRREQRNNATQGYHVSAWIKGEYHGAQSGDIVATWGSAIIERTMVATSLDCAIRKDDSAGNAETTTTTNPSTGATGTLTNAGFAICYFGSNGPIEDHGSATARIDDGGVWTAATIGQQAGTTGNGATSNVTIVETYLQLTATNATRGELQSATSRRWANVILVAAQRASLNNQGVSVSDVKAVEDIVVAAGGDVNDIVFGLNEDTGEYEAFVITSPPPPDARYDDFDGWVVP